MQSAGGGDKKTERKEQKFEPVAAVPVIVDVSIRNESASRRFDYICPLSTDRSEMNETWLCMGFLRVVTCWDLENDTMHDLLDHDFMVTSLKLASFQGGARCQSIEIEGIKYGMLAVDNELIIFEAIRDPSGQFSRLSPHLRRDIFRKHEEKEYFKRMEGEESGRAGFTDGLPEVHYNRKVFPRKTEVFPGRQHVAIEYKGERIFIVGLSHDMSFSFAFPGGQRIDAFTINKDGVLIAFPSVGKGKPLPGYYFQVTVDFENQTAQIEKILSTLSYERVADVSCLSRDVLLTITEEKERKAAAPFTLSRATIAADNKSIKQDRILGKIFSPKACIALASGDVVYQTAEDESMHVFDNENKRTSSCPFDKGVAPMSLCRPRVVYFNGHFWSIPKFVNLKQALTDATRFSADLVRLISEYSTVGVDDGSREMALPASKSIRIRGATLMTDIPILSFAEVGCLNKIMAINTVDDLKQVINEALEQLNAILRLSRVDKFTGDFAILFDALLKLKERVESHWHTLKTLSEEPLLSVESRIVDETSRLIWSNLYRRARSLPEMKERVRAIDQEIRYRKLMDEKKASNPRAYVDTGELMANDVFREIISNIKAGNPSIKKIVKWLDFVKMHLKLSARASTTNKKRSASLFVHLPADEKKLSESELSRVITQIAKLGSEEKDKDVLKQVAQLLVDFAKRDDCPGPVKIQIEELVGHIRHIQVVDRYNPSSLEEARMLELFEKVITASKEVKVSAVHQAIVTWLEVGISQMPVPKTSKGGLFDEEKEVVAKLRELKGKMETVHRLITITQLGLDEKDPGPIKTISRHLLELAAYEGCPEKLKDQIGEVVRGLAKAFPAGPAPTNT